jgi:hypothetical protein
LEITTFTGSSVSNSLPDPLGSWPHKPPILEPRQARIILGLLLGEDDELEHKNGQCGWKRASDFHGFLVFLLLTALEDECGPSACGRGLENS